MKTDDCEVVLHYRFRFSTETHTQQFDDSLSVLGHIDLDNDQRFEQDLRALLGVEATQVESARLIIKDRTSFDRREVSETYWATNNSYIRRDVTWTRGEATESIMFKLDGAIPETAMTEHMVRISSDRQGFLFLQAHHFAFQRQDGSSGTHEM